MTVTAQAETLHFQAEVKQLLDLVINSLYSNKEIFLRELISNASDAADKLRFLALTDNALYEKDADLKINISFDREKRTITVRDNGIGMSRDEAITNLGTIAKSGTKEFLTQLNQDQKKDAHLIGQFGVGFYASFIVADKVTVLTRRAGLVAEHGVCWESTGKGDYSVTNIDRSERGTEIILTLKEGLDEFLDNWRLRSIVTKYSDHINLPIMMPALEGVEDKKEEKAEAATTQKKEIVWEQVNKATALWTRPKNEVTDEQYQELYKHIAHDYENPLTWAHHHVEGNLEYTSLIYLPARAPYDLWQRDKQHGLKLYVQRVFIMDQVEQFLPFYLRFVRGIVDTSSLPLNISREILQDHPTIDKLRSALTKRILDMLDKIAKDEPEKYAIFWEQFGNAIKEGPVEDFANRERIAKLVRFATTATDSAKQTVSFEEYLKRMKPEQKKIYYVTGENFAAANSSPHLEIFRKNQIEVILFYDRIDEWLVSHLAEFEGKSLQSIAKGEFNAEEISTPSSEEEKTEREKQEETLKHDFEAVLKQVQTVLSDKIKEVRLTQRLTTSPACLVTEAHDLGMQMQRILKATGQPMLATKPIFELNPNHALVQRLKVEQDDERFGEWAQLLFDQAVLAEGGQLSNPAEFVQRLNKMLLALS